MVGVDIEVDLGGEELGYEGGGCIEWGGGR